MEEEAKLDVALRVANFFAKHGRQKHEMVVVDPDQIVILNILGNLLCEQAVGLAVGVPCGLVEGDLTGVVMEEGPKDRVCQAVSMGMRHDRFKSAYLRSRCNVCRPAHHP